MERPLPRLLSNMGMILSPWDRSWTVTAYANLGFCHIATAIGRVKQKHPAYWGGSPMAARSS
jgi:hypothetical protein